MNSLRLDYIKRLIKLQTFGDLRCIVLSRPQLDNGHIQAEESTKAILSGSKLQSTETRGVFVMQRIPAESAYGTLSSEELPSTAGTLSHARYATRQTAQYEAQYEVTTLKFDMQLFF